MMKRKLEKGGNCLARTVIKSASNVVAVSVLSNRLYSVPVSGVFRDKCTHETLYSCEPSLPPPAISWAFRSQVFEQHAAKHRSHLFFRVTARLAGALRNRVQWSFPENPAEQVLEQTVQPCCELHRHRYHNEQTTQHSRRRSRRRRFWQTTLKRLLAEEKK